MTETLCATNPDLFFSSRPECTTAAKALCVACDVRLACLTLALERGEHGVWGGLDEVERARMSPATPSDTECALDGCNTLLPIASDPRSARRRYCSTAHSALGAGRAWSARQRIGGAA